jgi:hypothetical protein
VTFKECSQNCEKQELASSCLSVFLPVLMGQLALHWTFCEVWYFSVFQKSIKKIEVSLKLDKKTGTLHGDQYTF